MISGDLTMASNPGASAPSNPTSDYNNTHPSNGYNSGPPSMEMVCVKEEDIEPPAELVIIDDESPPPPPPPPQQHHHHHQQQHHQQQHHHQQQQQNKIKPEPVKSFKSDQNKGPGPSEDLSEWLKCFKDHILKPIFKHSKSVPFRKPVDAIALGIYPAYFQVVTQPMDLGTIRKKIDTGKYHTKEHCTSDLMLVWMNALTFNPPMHYVYNAALEFKKITSYRLEILQSQGIKAFMQSVSRKSHGRKISGGGGSRSSGGGSHSFGPRKEGSRKTFKQDRAPSIGTRQPLRQLTSPPPLPTTSNFSDDGLGACDTLLRSLLSLRTHCDFVQPFMSIESDPQFYDDGRVPLSLSRIERKLRTQQYKNYIEFASDMRQMFTETYKYNNPDSPMVTAAGKLQKEFEVRFAKINFQERKPVRPALLPQSLSEEEQFAAKLRSAQNFMRKIEAELKELIRDYHRMKNRRKRKLQQAHKNGMAETGAQINAACIAVVDAFADSPQTDFKSDALSNSSYNDATSHVVSPVTTQPNAPNMYNLPKKARLEPPPVLTLQEANELKEQISQLHPDQQLQILEILQNNGEQLFPDEHGEVEIEIAKCCLGSVKQVRAYLQNLKAQIKMNDETRVTSSVDPVQSGNDPTASASKRMGSKKDRNTSDSDSSSDGSSSDSSDSSSDSD